MSLSTTSLWLWPRKLLAGLVHGYRWTLKPWLGNACRFEPSCSAYALQALERHGALAGSALTGWRLLRCHPWCDGGLDPVPARAAEVFAGRSCGHGLFTRLWPGERAQSQAPHSLEPSRRGLCRPGEITGPLP